MKTMNKVIAAMMMAITLAMPAMAGNKNHNGKKDKVVAVNNKKVSHFDKKGRWIKRPHTSMLTSMLIVQT